MTTWARCAGRTGGRGRGRRRLPARPGAATGVALIVVDARGENQIAVASGANARVDGQPWTRRWPDPGRREDVLLAGSRSR